MNAIETMKDALGRAYDAAKFWPRFDRLKRWVNRRAGRKPRNAPKSPFQPKEIAPMTTTEPTAPETPAPAAGDNATPPAAHPAAPSFNDIEAASRVPDQALGNGAAGESTAGGASDAAQGDAFAHATSETIIGIIQTALVLIGEDEGVLSEQEKLLVRRPLERVLSKYGVGSDVLPPEVDLAVALATVIIVRLKRPKTATAFARFKDWLGRKIARRRGEKLAEKVADATKAENSVK